MEAARLLPQPDLWKPFTANSLRWDSGLPRVSTPRLNCHRMIESPQQLTADVLSIGRAPTVARNQELASSTETRR
jgi:hypothetical protein